MEKYTRPEKGDIIIDFLQKCVNVDNTDNLDIKIIDLMGEEEIFKRTAADIV